MSNTTRRRLAYNYWNRSAIGRRCLRPENDHTKITMSLSEIRKAILRAYLAGIEATTRIEGLNGIHTGRYYE